MSVSWSPAWICEPCSGTDSEFSDAPVAESTRQSDQIMAVDNEISFNLSDNFEIPQEQEEATIADPTLHEELEGLGDVPVTSFKITTGGTVRGKNILVDSNGYTYTMKWKKDPTSPFSAWVCGLRSKTQRCPVSVLQNGDRFKFGRNEHHHHPAVGDVAVAVKVAVKKAAKDNVFRPASDIVEGVLTKMVPADAPVNCPRPSNLTRAANRARQRQRPQEPQDQGFERPRGVSPTGYSCRGVPTCNICNLRTDGGSRQGEDLVFGRHV
ncbi:uncharacterized protein [Asterias amurensis]|uniref:uncharacterized protein n=1 Tax=Asterias amurensis TaxID=7602 RepID=UPI003AB28596